MELTIAGDDLRAVLKDSHFGKKLGKGYIRDATVDLSFDGKGLSISVLTLDARVAAAGTWTGTVRLPLANWNVLQKVPPSASSLTVRYDTASSKLFIGSSGFKAVWVK